MHSKFFSFLRSGAVPSLVSLSLLLSSYGAYNAHQIAATLSAQADALPKPEPQQERFVVKGEPVVVSISDDIEDPQFVVEPPTSYEIIADRHLTISTQTDGRYVVIGIGVRGGKSAFEKTIVLVGAKKPDKIVVTPPEPTPSPTPPPPSPAPIADKGFRFAIIAQSEDAADVDNLKYVNVMNSTKLRAYLNTHAVKVNGVPEWRILDPDDDLKNETKIWQDVLQRPRTAKFWYVVSDGVNGEEDQLPDNEDALLEICKKYGGP